MKINLNKIYKYYDLEFILLFFSLFSVFFLWDIKSDIIDLRFLIIILSLVFFYKNFKFLNFKIDYLIIFLILFFIIHYYLNVTFRDLKFDKNIIFFSIYLLISYYYLKFQKVKFGKIFQIISKIFLLVVLFNILLNFKNFVIIENTQSGACGLFTNFSDFNLRLLGENSHFGMVAPGAILCILFSVKENELFNFKNVIFYTLILILSLSVFSMTLLLGLVVGFFGLIFSLNKKNYKYFIMPIILVILAISSITLKESCLSRIERINFLDNIDYLKTKKQFDQKASNTLDNLDVLKNNLKSKDYYSDLLNCKDYINLNNKLTSNNLEIKKLENEINNNSKKINKFKNTSSELFSLQLETKILKDQKDVVLNETFEKVIENIFKKKIYDRCNVYLDETDDNDLDLEIQKFLNINKVNVAELENLKNKLNKKAIIINNSEKEYKNPNITTQVYQISFFNTYSSIIDNPLGWGYNNYAYSHFKYVIDNIVKLNIDTKVEINKINQNQEFNVEINMQDPDVFYLNYNDGRNNFAKLITEFGYFSIILFIFLIIFGLSKKATLIEKSFLIPIIGTQLGSGAGYANGGFAIAIILALIIYRKSVYKI